MIIYIATNKIIGESMIKECIKGNHDLIEIYRSYSIYDEEQVVRWCRVCGSVVIDVEIDGRIRPGGVMKIKAPESYGRLI